MNVVRMRTEHFLNLAPGNSIIIKITAEILKNSNNSQIR